MTLPPKLCSRAPPAGELAPDRAAVLGALAQGRCYLAVDALAPARGFRFWAQGEQVTVPLGAEVAGGRWVLHVRAPRRAELILLRDGEPVARAMDDRLTHAADGPGVWRVEARLPCGGRARPWILSNPVYLRP